MQTQDSSAGATSGLGEFRSRGRVQFVPMRRIEGREVIVTGRWPRIAKLNDEEWVEGHPAFLDPEKFVSWLRSGGPAADIFTFCGPIGDSAEGFPYPFDVDNVAAICTDDYEKWWEGLPQQARKSTRRATKRGVELRVAAFDDAFISGIKAIYDETPIRQGRRFWHFGKDIDVVRRENASYLDRAEFIGAYLGQELIGFIKYVFVDDVARIMQILCLNAHQDKRPMIALIVKAAERCHERGAKYLVYGKYTYGQKVESSITEFKRRLGFKKIPVRRYYAPLSLSGTVALKLGAQKSLYELVPGPVVNLLLEFRSGYLKHTK